MDGSTSTSKTQFIIRPLILKAGIPLAISIAGFIGAKIMARRNRIPDSDHHHQDSTFENKVSSNKIITDSCSSSYSLSSTFEEEIISSTTHFINSIENDNYKPDYEEEIISLKHQVEELQKKEWETKLQLVRYHDLREQESVLMELRNMLSLEKAYVELLDREILSMGAENKRVDNWVVQYLTVLDQLQYWKSENVLLQSKVKKLLRKTEQKSRIIREKNQKIEAGEEELLRNSDAMNQLENQVKEQQSVIDQLQEQKNELLNKLDPSSSSISKIEDDYEGSSRMEDYKQLVNEYEQLQKDRADEIKELIYLRWTNACLKHELMKNQEYVEQEKKNTGMEQNDAESFKINVENVDAFAFSKRKKFVEKLKRWVDGSEKMRSKFGEKEKHGMKCFRNGKHSVSYETETKTETELDNDKLTVLARESCSSA